MLKRELLLIPLLALGSHSVAGPTSTDPVARPGSEIVPTPVAGPTGPRAHLAQDPCVAAARRQFDFWLGDWQVSNPAGKAAGTSRITSILGGCVLREEFASANGGYAGTSFNIYDASTDRWHQTWVDTGGLLLQLDGGLRDGRMILEGSRVNRQGRSVRDRITWQPLEGGRVRQVWTVSPDGGETWNQVFDGIYSSAP